MIVKRLRADDVPAGRGEVGKNRSGRAMPANANTRESFGTTTVSPVPTMRGGSSERVMWYALRACSARPMRSAAS